MWKQLGLPYIKSMIEDGSDVLILSEHWLWPYETCKLNEIHSEFQCDCKSDARLNEKQICHEDVLELEYCGRRAYNPH